MSHEVILLDFSCFFYHEVIYVKKCHLIIRQNMKFAVYLLNEVMELYLHGVIKIAQSLLYNQKRR